MVVSGTNTRLGSTASVGWTGASNLSLNSAGAFGSGSAAIDAIVIQSTAVLDNSSVSSVTLSNGGVKQLDASFSWAGTNDLNLGTGTTTWSAARTFTFIGAGTGTLTIPTATTTLATSTWNIGVTAGAKQTLSLNGTNLSLSSGAAGQLLRVTAGYFRVNNAGGLGNATTTMWTVSSGAALEVNGGISPTGARSVTITGHGPNIDGALRSVSGSNVWNGAIVPPVQSLASPTRIQVDAGTFTLSTSGSPSYTTIAPTVSGTPLQFTALGAAAVLNQPRQLTNTVSDVTINNGGVGTVVLSVANNHTGGTTVEGGTCKVTQINATSTGAVQVNASATLESTVQSEFTTLRLGTTGSGARAILKFAA
jgi:autotransporter-associated beta strand protein